MADTKWTKEQERAISDRGKGIIVSAAAGSGKTTVLIERMIQLLSDEKNKIPADRLLAVTFTKEAASSMKEKLSRAFDEQLRRDPENKWLLSQQNLIQLARISTINSFCLDLVKSNLHEFDFQGGLDILDDSVQTLILQEAITQAYENLCEEDYESYKLLKKVLRQDWGFQGYVVSDCGGPSLLVNAHKYVRSEERRVGKECRSRWSPYH